MYNPFENYLFAMATAQQGIVPFSAQVGNPGMPLPLLLPAGQNVDAWQIQALQAQACNQMYLAQHAQAQAQALQARQAMQQQQQALFGCVNQPLMTQLPGIQMPLLEQPNVAVASLHLEQKSGAAPKEVAKQSLSSEIKPTKGNKKQQSKSFMCFAEPTLLVKKVIEEVPPKPLLEDIFEGGEAAAPPPMEQSSEDLGEPLEPEPISPQRLLQEQTEPVRKLVKNIDFIFHREGGVLAEKSTQVNDSLYDNFQDGEDQEAEGIDPEEEFFNNNDDVIEILSDEESNRIENEIMAANPKRENRLSLNKSPKKMNLRVKDRKNYRTIGSDEPIQVDTRSKQTAKKCPSLNQIMEQLKETNKSKSPIKGKATGKDKPKRAVKCISSDSEESADEIVDNLPHIEKDKEASSDGTRTTPLKKMKKDDLLIYTRNLEAELKLKEIALKKKKNQQ